MPYDFKNPSGRDIASTVLMGALKGYLINDQRRYDNQVAQRDQGFRQQNLQQTADLQQRNQLALDAQNNQQTVDLEGRREKRAADAAAFSTILDAIGKGAELTPDLVNQAHAVSGMDPDRTKVVLDAAQRGAAARLKQEQDKIAAEGKQHMAEIGARGAQDRLTDASKPKAAAEAKPEDPWKRRTAIRGIVEGWTNIQANKRTSDWTLVKDHLQDHAYLDAVASLMYDKGISTADAVHYIDNVENVALELATNLGVKPENFDDPILDTKALQDIASSMGVTIQATAPRISLLDLATTGAGADTLSRILESYKQAKTAGAGGAGSE